MSFFDYDGLNLYQVSRRSTLVDHIVQILGYNCTLNRSHFQSYQVWCIKVRGPMWAFPTPPLVSTPNLDTHLKWTLMFKWYEIRCGSTNGQQTAIFLKQIGLHNGNLSIICRFKNQHNWGWGGGGGPIYDHLV